MKYKIFKKVLLIGGLLFSTSQNFWANEVDQVKLVDQDKFVFKVAGQVFSLQDLHAYYRSMRIFGCYDSHSLIRSFFSNELKKENETFYTQDNLIFSENQKIYFQKIITFAKLLMYSKSFEQSSNLKEFETKIRAHKCSNGHNLGDLIVYIKEVKVLDHFLSSRFLPRKEDYLPTKQDLSKARSGVQNLINSIQKQIDQEVYW